MYIMVCISYSLLQASSIPLRVCVPGSLTPFVAMPVYGTCINSASLGAWAGVMSLSVSVLDVCICKHGGIHTVHNYEVCYCVKCMLVGSDL